MGILGGAMTVRRFRVVGEVPDDFRTVYQERLNEDAFRESPVGQGKEEAEGWVQVHNLLDNEFDDVDKWLYDSYLLFALRVDKKTLPAKLLAAHVAKKCDLWAKEHEQDRCPASERTKIKDALEEEWLARTLPRAAVTEVVWNIQEGWLLLHSQSDGTMDRFRKRFHRTFGMVAIPWSPLDWVDEENRTALIDTSPSLELSVEAS